MDPYLILGVPRGCTREQVKDAYRALVHRAHPDRGGDGEAFVRLCAAYREVLNDLDRGGDQEDEEAVVIPSVRVAAVPPGPDAARGSYVSWLRRVSEESRRRQSIPWWRKHPERAKAWLLGLIGLGGVLVLCAALALGMRLPGQAAPARERSGIGRGPVGRRPSDAGRTRRVPDAGPPRPARG